MPPNRTVGLVGYGRIGQFIANQIAEEPHISLAYIYARDASSIENRDADIIDDQNVLEKQNVDLVVEAAHADLVSSLSEQVLESSDLLILSTTALADRTLEEEIMNRCETADARLYVPHGAVLGTDGLQDGRPSLNEVSVTTRKNPSNIDFTQTDINQDDIDSETKLYDGRTRGICTQFPRNVNSHATIALAGLGFDRTNSTLIADPSATTAVHQIIAEGDGTTLEITRSSAIEGVTGSYTLDSIWGTIQRILNDAPGIAIV